MKHVQKRDSKLYLPLSKYGLLLFSASPILFTLEPTHERSNSISPYPDNQLPASSSLSIGMKKCENEHLTVPYKLNRT